jgi:hypothetical protein
LSHTIVFVVEVVPVHSDRVRELCEQAIERETSKSESGNVKGVGSNGVTHLETKGILA